MRKGIVPTSIRVALTALLRGLGQLSRLLGKPGSGPFLASG